MLGDTFKDNPNQHHIEALAIKAMKTLTRRGDGTSKRHEGKDFVVEIQPRSKVWFVE